MTLFTVNHPDGTYSTRESDKDLRWAVVVYTPAETRQHIRALQRLILEASMDNIHRALADGTRSIRDDRTYIGGLQVPDEETLLVQYQATLEFYNEQPDEFPDLYQATHWFEERPDAWRASDVLQEEYDNTPWLRHVSITGNLYLER